YKERFCKVHQKLCELTGDVSITKLGRRIEFTGTDSADINRCIERFVNKTGQFPDFHDILKLVENVESNKNLRPEALRRIAEKAFLTVGRQLQKKRQFESWDSLCGYLKDQVDPADENPELDSALKENLKQNSDRIQKVIDGFAEKQVNDNLVAEEVPDEVADKSEGSEDEKETAEDQDEEEEDDDNDYVDNVLREDNEDCLGEDAVDMDQDVENGSSNDEDEDKDVESVEEKNSVHSHSSDVNNHNLEDTNEENECAELSMSDLNLVPIRRNLGPVSPPVLGEVLRDDDFLASPATVKDESSSTLVKDSNKLKINEDNCSKKERKTDDFYKNEQKSETDTPSHLGNLNEIEEESSNSPSLLEDLKGLKNGKSENCSEKKEETGNNFSESDKLESNVPSHLGSRDKSDKQLESDVPSYSENKDEVEKDSKILKPENSKDEDCKKEVDSKTSKTPSPKSESSDSLELENSNESSNSSVDSVEHKNKKFVVTKIEVESSDKNCVTTRNKLKKLNNRKKSHLNTSVIAHGRPVEGIDVITIE
ncbi:hypothetical protein L9F63_006537, partial [Diploptera punctata]